MKKREGDSFMPPPQYGHSLKGITINVLVTDMDRAVEFQRDVVQSAIVYSDPDITIVRGYGTDWMRLCVAGLARHFRDSTLTGKIAIQSL